MEPIDPIMIRVGSELIDLVDPKQGSPLLACIGPLRQRMAHELGVVLPGVRFRDDSSLKTAEFVVHLREEEVLRGEVRPSHLLVSNFESSPDQAGPTDCWVPEECRQQYADTGHTLLTPLDVISQRLDDCFHSHISTLLTFSQVDKLLANPTLQPIVNELLPRHLEKPAVWKVLVHLAEEGVSIRDLEIVLQTLLVHASAKGDKDVLRMAELTRYSLRERTWAQIKVECKGPHPLAWFCPPSFEQAWRGKLTSERRWMLFAEVELKMARLETASRRPLLVTSPEYRRFLWEFLHRRFPRLRLISRLEIPPAENVVPLE